MIRPCERWALGPELSLEEPLGHTFVVGTPLQQLSSIVMNGTIGPGLEMRPECREWQPGDLRIYNFCDPMLHRRHGLAEMGVFRCALGAEQRTLHRVKRIGVNMIADAGVLPRPVDLIEQGAPDFLDLMMTGRLASDRGFAGDPDRLGDRALPGIVGERIDRGRKTLCATGCDCDVGPWVGERRREPRRAPIQEDVRAGSIDAAQQRLLVDLTAAGIAFQPSPPGELAFALRFGA